MHEADAINKLGVLFKHSDMMCYFPALQELARATGVGVRDVPLPAWDNMPREGIWRVTCTFMARTYIISGEKTEWSITTPRNTLLQLDTSDGAKALQKYLMKWNRMRYPLVFRPMGRHAIPRHQFIVLPVDSAAIVPLGAEELPPETGDIASLFIVTEGGHVVKELVLDSSADEQDRETRSVRVGKKLFRSVGQNLELGIPMFHPVATAPNDIEIRKLQNVFNISTRTALDFRSAVDQLSESAYNVRYRHPLLPSQIGNIMAVVARWRRHYSNTVRGVVRSDALSGHNAALVTAGMNHELNRMLDASPSILLLDPIILVPAMYAPTRLIGAGADSYRIPTSIARTLRKDMYVSMRLGVRLTEGFPIYLSVGRPLMRGGRNREDWQLLPQYHEGCFGNLTGLVEKLPDGCVISAFIHAVTKLCVRVVDAYSRINVSSPANLHPVGLPPLPELRKMCEKEVYRDTTARIL